MMTNDIIKKVNEFAYSHSNDLCFDSENQKMTYKELDMYSDSLAAYIEQHYPNKESIIVFGGQDARMLISFLACTKSGHAYVPVDAHTPLDRVQMIVEESNATCIISLEKWELDRNNVIGSALFQDIINRGSKPDLNSPVNGDDTYYIIFTSGTTGKPKGVQISYNNLISFTDWMIRDFKLTRSQRFLCQAPFSFDLSVMDVYPSLLTGGTLVPMEKSIVESFPLLFSTIPKLAINVWVSTPSLVEICLLNPEFNSEKLPMLENFQFCGEELPRAVAMKLMDRFPNAFIYNTYGPTEATVAITQVQITKDVLESCDRLPLGKVKNDTRLLIVSEDGSELSEGEIGEIVIVGPGVSSGYYNNPEKTADAFYRIEKQQAYKTGDAGLIQDGMLFYKGRLDFQIKWHGYRIELGDIDHHLMSVSTVRNACVVPKYNKNHKVQQIIAYVVSNLTSDFDEKKEAVRIKEELSQLVMDYMIPQRIIFCDTLPLSANGKVDRKQLMSEVNK